MKAEETNEKPALDLMNPTLNEGMSHAKSIKFILINNGQWYRIEPGSMHFYKTTDSVPFIRFKARLGFSFKPENDEVMTVEVFPATVAGWAY